MVRKSGFNQYVRDHLIVEWSPGYVHYDEIMEVIRVFKILAILYKKFIHSNNQVKSIINRHEIRVGEQNQINKLGELLRKFIRLQERKFDAFVQYKVFEIYEQWKQIQQAALRLEELSIRSHKFNENRYLIKRAIEVNYQNITNTKIFIKLNEEILTLVKSKIKKYVNDFYSVSLQQSFNFRSRNKIENLEQLVFNIYSKQYCSPYNRTKLKDLVVNRNKITKPKEYLYLGFFLGFTIFLVLIMSILFASNVLPINFNEEHPQSFKYIFPMFRGVALFILYLWGLAWNVYGFTAFNINYRLILKFDNHYSTYTQIMKRAGFFTLVFLIAFILYLIGKSSNMSNNTNYPIEYTPFIVYLIYFTYIFFPSQSVFNPKGRRFFYKTILNIITSPILQMNFIIAWSTDQMVSFVGPLKDLAYTLCYYTSDFSLKEIKQCSNIKSIEGILIGYIVALIPLIYRMIQCVNAGRQSSQKRFFGHLQMWNFFKYTSSVITASVSFLLKFYPTSVIIEYLFIGFSIFSTCYAYYWDLKYDWGFLQTNSKNRLLRDSLSYKSTYVYYFAIITNFILRCSWTLSIASVSTLPFISKFDPTLLLLITSFLEMFRRCMWNFFRIQKEHVANCQAFRTTENSKQILQDINKGTHRKLSDESDIYDRFENALLIMKDSMISSKDLRNQYSHVYSVMQDCSYQIVTKAKMYFQNVIKQQQQFLLTNNIEDRIKCLFLEIGEQKLSIVRNQYKKIKNDD